MDKYISDVLKYVESNIHNKFNIQDIVGIGYNNGYCDEYWKDNFNPIILGVNLIIELSDIIKITLFNPNNIYEKALVQVNYG